VAQALEGIKVLHMSRLPCSRCTMYLADLGAELIKIEAPPCAGGYASEPHTQKGEGRGWRPTMP